MLPDIATDEEKQQRVRQRQRCCCCCCCCWLLTVRAVLSAALTADAVDDLLQMRCLLCQQAPLGLCSCCLSLAVVDAVHRAALGTGRPLSVHRYEQPLCVKRRLKANEGSSRG